jgi:hypothetical protein
MTRATQATPRGQSLVNDNYKSYYTPTRDGYISV